jgi:hypothetical protein
MIIEVRYIRQKGPPGHFACVTLDVEPASAFEITNEANLEEDYFNGLTEGLKYKLSNRAYKIKLTAAKTHFVDSGKRSFYRAGMEAAEKILNYE